MTPDAEAVAARDIVTFDPDTLTTYAPAAMPVPDKSCPGNGTVPEVIASVVVPFVVPTLL